MVMLGFMLNYMLRVNLTIAIVAMVTPSNGSAGNASHTVMDAGCGGSPIGTVNLPINGTVDVANNFTVNLSKAIHAEVPIYQFLFPVVPCRIQLRRA